MSVALNGRAYFANELPVGPRWLDYSDRPLTATIPYPWDDERANVRADIEDLKAIMMRDLVFEPNALVVSGSVYTEVFKRPALVELLVRYREPRPSAYSLTFDELAAVFGVRRFIVAKANEGEDEAAIAFYGTSGTEESVAVYWEGLLSEARAV